MKTWKLLNPERYEIQLSKEEIKDDDGKITKTDNLLHIAKKSDAPQLFDDGLVI